MKRRHWLTSLLGIGGLSTVVQVQDKVDAAVAKDCLPPFRVLTRSKTDFGIPAVIEAGKTPHTEHMQVCIDRGQGEVPFEHNCVMAVDTTTGRALVWPTLPVKQGDSKDIFGYSRTPSRSLESTGPYVIHGDFRIRWLNKPRTDEQT